MVACLLSSASGVEWPKGVVGVGFPDQSYDQCLLPLLVESHLLPCRVAARVRENGTLRETLASLECSCSIRDGECSYWPERCRIDRKTASCSTWPHEESVGLSTSVGEAGREHQHRPCRNCTMQQTLDSWQSRMLHSSPSESRLIFLSIHPMPISRLACC
jgi:hypothetical protein